MMDHYRNPATAADKQDAHRRRFEAGQRMVKLLQRRADSKMNDTEVDDDVDIDEMRAIVWNAEYEALQLDPELRHVPKNLIAPPDAE